MKKKSKILMVVVDYTPDERLNKALEKTYLKALDDIGIDASAVIFLEKSDDNNEAFEKTLLNHIAVCDEVWYFLVPKKTSDAMAAATAMGMAARDVFGTKIRFVEERFK